VDVRGGRQPAYPGARRASDRPGQRRQGPCTVGPAGSPQPYAPPRRRAALAADAGLPDAARPHGRLQRQRRRLEPLGLPRRDREAPPRASRRRLRCRPRPGAAGADPGLGRDRVRGSAGRGHLPCLRAAPAAAADRDRGRRPAQVQSAQCPDRRLRGRRVDGPALVRGQLRDHPERRRRRALGRGPARGGRRGGAAAAVRRAGRGAEGPAGPAARLRGPRRARPGAPRRRRPRVRGHRAQPRRPGCARRDRGARRRLA